MTGALGVAETWKLPSLWRVYPSAGHTGEQRCWCVVVLISRWLSSKLQLDERSVAIAEFPMLR